MLIGRVHTGHLIMWESRSERASCGSAGGRARCSAGNAAATSGARSGQTRRPQASASSALTSVSIRSWVRMASLLTSSWGIAST
ncbi:hypothetical protein FHS43_003901 [Streptosporangium becharense]|uniref:hypothetical protein n=1 Tax=Streptosporangium becharense TaxID=1816182 RepID=UPI00161147F1|nr:hypothetical protein [Streptosporangium becharense]MBB2912618.1 hypothetical protein [Streptosporangium becharense]